MCVCVHSACALACVRVCVWMGVICTRVCSRRRRRRRAHYLTLSPGPFHGENVTDGTVCNCSWQVYTRFESQITFSPRVLVRRRLYDLKIFMIENPRGKTVLISAAGTRIHVIIIMYALVREAHTRPWCKRSVTFTDAHVRKSRTPRSNDMSVDDLILFF